MRPASRTARAGTISVELALVVPVLGLLALGTSDIVGLLRAQLRLDMAAQQVGQLVSQCNRIVAPGDINQFWAYAQRVVGGFATLTGPGANGAVIISAIGRIDGANRVTWQYRTGGGLFLSNIGTSGGTATLPGGVNVPDGQTMFVTEVYLRRQQWPMAGALMGGSTPRTLMGESLFLTRAPDAPSLQAVPANNAQPACTA